MNMNQGGQENLGDLDFTRPGAIPGPETMKMDRTSGHELTPLDAEILDVVNEINRLEPLMKVPMIPSEAEKIEQAYNDATRKKRDLLDKKFAIAKGPESRAEGPIQDQDLTSRRLSRDRTDSAGNPLQ